MLTDKELSRLQQAMDSGQEIAIEVSIAGMQIKASTTPATPAWGCDMLVRLECTRVRCTAPSILTDSQIFKSEFVHCKQIFGQSLAQDANGKQA